VELGSKDVSISVSAKRVKLLNQGLYYCPERCHLEVMSTIYHEGSDSFVQVPDICSISACSHLHSFEEIGL